MPLGLQSNSNYQLLLRYIFQPNNISEYHFSVEPFWYQSEIFKDTIQLFFTSLVFIIPFYIRHKNKQQLLLKTNFEKSQKKLELKSLYAQLNPHFIFNALNSIQSLINQNKVEGANHYLTEFGSLLRQTLNNNEKEMVPLNIEINSLKNYLNLEQLRFNFKYQIEIDASIQLNTTEIPSLLLQPIIENGIKHGISTLNNNGEILIHFLAINKNMIATIKDNGMGFNVNELTNGYGLKLTKDRIALMNQSLNDSKIEMDIFSNLNGTIVTINFKNWLE